MIRVVVVGAKGKMGRIAVESIDEMDGYQVVGKTDREDNLDAVLKKTKPDIAIEFSGIEGVTKNSWTIVKNAVRPVIGSSGLSQAELDKLSDFCKANNIGGFIVPNFSLGMVISKKIVTEMAVFFKDISIVEFHNTQKKDKPSGTASDLARSIGLDESVITSVRSDGFVAKQQVYLGRIGERVVVDHETFDRKASFGAGIQLCCEKVMGLSQLVVGIDKIIGL